MLSGMDFHAADTHRATSEGAAHKRRLKERCGLELRLTFFRLRNRQKLVRIRFGCGLDSRIYGIFLLQDMNTDVVFSVFLDCDITDLIKIG